MIGGCPRVAGGFAEVVVLGDVVSVFPEHFDVAGGHVEDQLFRKASLLSTPSWKLAVWAVMPASTACWRISAVPAAAFR